MRLFKACRVNCAMPTSKVAPHPEALPAFHDKCRDRMLEFKDWRPEDIQSIGAPTRVMIGLLADAGPEFAVWGAVVRNLTWSDIAREILRDAGADPAIPAFSTVMACSTSMMGAIEAAGMIDGTSRNLALVGGVDSLTRIQAGLGEPLSVWVRKFQQARSLGEKVSHLTDLKPGDIRLSIPG